MNLLKLLNGKFLIVLTLAMSLAALTATASAEDNVYFTNFVEGGTSRLSSINPDGSHQINLIDRPDNDQGPGSAPDDGQRGFADQGDCLDFVEPAAAAAAETSSARPHAGGVNVILADGAVRFSVAVGEVMLPNSPLEFDRVDAQDPNAATKIRMLFDAADRMQSAVVLTVPKDSIAVPARFRTAQLIVGNGTKSRMEIKMQELLITSYGNGGSSALNSVAVKFSSLSYR